jgi:hypothetical protein
MSRGETVHLSAQTEVVPPPFGLKVASQLPSLQPVSLVQTSPAPGLSTQA